MADEPIHPEHEAPEPSKVQMIADTARDLLGKVRLIALLAAVAALWLWGVMYYPFTAFERVGDALPAVLLSGLMLLPAGILFLFYGGLRELIHLPQRISEMARSGQDDLHTATGKMQAVPEARTSSWTIGRLFQGIWALRGIIVRYKATLVKYAAAIRLFTVPFLFLVFLALVVSAVFLVVAVLSVPLVVIGWLL